MLQSRAVSGQNRFLEKTGCCRAEQFLDRIDSWKRQDAAEQFLDRIDSWKRHDAAEQSRSWIEQIPGKYRMLQSSSWIEQISGKDRMLQSRAPGENRFPEKNMMLISRAAPEQYRFPEKNRMLQSRACLGAEQFVEGKDRMLQSRAICEGIRVEKSQDAAEEKNWENFLLSVSACFFPQI